MLGPSGHLGLDPGLLEPAGQDLEHRANVAFAIGASARNMSLEHRVNRRVDVAKGGVLEFRFEPVDAQPMRNRSVNLERLARDLFLLVGRQVVERAHVVQPVGELDEHDTDIMRHREDHFAEVLGLLLLAALKCDLRNLGGAVDQPRDLGAK